MTNTPSNINPSGLSQRGVLLLPIYREGVVLGVDPGAAY